MEIDLIPPTAKFIESQLKAGRYASASDIVNAALTILQRHEQEFERLTPEELEELRREIAVGIDELDRGEGKPWDAEEIKARLRARFAGKQAAPNTQEKQGQSEKIRGKRAI